MTLADWGWNDHWAKLAEQLDVDVGSVARVVGQDRASWSIWKETGPGTARMLPAHTGDLRPAVGDWIVLEPGPLSGDPSSILAVFPRTTQISRGSAGTGGEEQVLAANVDKVWVVHGLDRDINQRQMERYLAVVWECGASPEIILTKSDMAEDLVGFVAQAQAVAFGVPIRTVSSKQLESIDNLRETLEPGSTISLLGPSGVGKSTLVNLLAEATHTSTGEVRDGDRKGRHVTTRRELFRLPGGALLLDTPGMRELRVWLLGEGLDHTFPDIESLAQECRFRDCKHEAEPDCAVKRAVENGELEPGRLANFHKLQAEAAYELRKNDPRARAAEVSAWKTALKTLKYHPKYKERKNE